MRISLNLLFSFFLIAVACTPKTDLPTADIIINQTSIWTGDPDALWAEAIALRGDSILSIGTNEQVEPYLSSSTQIINAEGQLVTPGFIDTHVHLMSGGYNLLSVQLRNASSAQEFAKILGDYAQSVPEGTWIIGGDWDHTLWDGELPKRSWIDSVTSKHPVFVSRLDGHMALANSLAMELTGVTGQVQDIAGGEIVRDKNNILTGVFKDNAMNLIADRIPEKPVTEKLTALKAAMKYLTSNGVTKVHDVGSNFFKDLPVYQTALDNNDLILRLYAIAPLARWADLNKMVDDKGKGNEWLNIGGVKGFVDGSLGSHTAAFFEPFTDAPDDKGLLLEDIEVLQQMIGSADSCGLQVNIHAIGDRAIHELLNIYEKVITEKEKLGRRFRIEHAQHLGKEDIPRFKELGVIASMQPYHAIDDGRWAEEVIGPERIKTTYAFKSLINAGAMVAFGSDWTVAPGTPLEGIYAAVTRQTLDGANPDGWVPEEKITIEEALTAYTVNAAYAGRDEKYLGSLTVGKKADLVILDKNIFEIDPVEIKNVKVLKTIVGGKVVFE